MSTKNYLKTIAILSIMLPLSGRSQVFLNTAGPILDQSDTSFSSGAYVQDSISMAQTFTPGVSGTLWELDLFMSNHDTSEGKPLIISIYNTQGGVPDMVLGTVNLSNVGVNYAWYSLDFSAKNISLTADHLYSIVLSCPGTFYGIYPGGSVGDSYSRGIALVQNGTGASWQPYDRARDLMFQTWMAPVPEPSTFGLLALGTVFLARARRNHRMPNHPLQRRWELSVPLTRATSLLLRG